MDLKTFFAETADALDPAMGPGLPTFPTSSPGCGSKQVFEIKEVSHSSHVSHDQEWVIGLSRGDDTQARMRAGAGARAREIARRMVGNAGTVGNARSAIGLPFPQQFQKVGKVRTAAGSDPLSLPAAPVVPLPPTFDERAAFLEYECNLSRAEAEAQARSEIAQATAISPLPAPQPATVPLPAVDGLTLWRAGLARLRTDQPPCPGYRSGEWHKTYARALQFLDEFGLQAEALGWTASRLFGVHPEAGIVRVDACGALALPIAGPVRAITATEISLGHLTHRQKLGQPAGVPLWLFQPPEQSPVRVGAPAEEPLNLWGPLEPWGPVRARASAQESLNPWELPESWDPSDPPLF